MHTYSQTNGSVCSISITFVYIKQILDDVEYDVINYRSWKSYLNTSLEFIRKNLQRCQIGKSTECVFINASDVVEG